MSNKYIAGLFADRLEELKTKEEAEAWVDAIPYNVARAFLLKFVLERIGADGRDTEDNE